MAHRMIPEVSIRLGCPILALILLAGVAEPGRCQGAGTYAFASLRRSTTAQETSWGGLEGAGAPGPEALRANPAGLAAETGVSFTLSHRVWSSDLQEQSAGWSGPLGPGSLALEVAATHAGSFDAFDEAGNSLGTFRPIEGIAGAGYGARVSGAIRIGGSFHALYLGSPGSHLTGFSSSWGVESTIPGGSVGLSLRNLGPDVRGEEGTYRLPAEAAIGVTRSILGSGIASLTGTIDRDRVVGLSGGARWAASSSFALMLGAGYRPGDADPAIRPGGGVEITVGSVGVAYAFAPDPEGLATHHVSLRFLGHTREPGIETSRLPAVEPKHEEGIQASPLPPVAETHEPGIEASRLPPKPATWAVWGGTHRTREGAMSEVHALEMQHVEGATIVPGLDGWFRVRVATRLVESDAKALAHILNANAVPE